MDLWIYEHLKQCNCSLIQQFGQFEILKDGKRVSPSAPIYQRHNAFFMRCLKTVRTILILTSVRQLSVPPLCKTISTNALESVHLKNDLV